LYVASGSVVARVLRIIFFESKSYRELGMVRLANLGGFTVVSAIVESSGSFGFDRSILKLVRMNKSREEGDCVTFFANGLALYLRP
jgi:hypothetical protein